MKSFSIYPEHRKAAAIFLAIFALTAIIFFGSCSTTRRDESSGCYAQKHYVGYGAGGYKHGRIRNWRRASFSH